MSLDIEQVIKQAIDVQGGVRSNVEPYYLEKNQMYYLQNVDLDDLGARKKRDGCLSYGTGGMELGGLAEWVFGDGTRKIAGFWDNGVFTTEGDSAWSRADQTGISLTTDHRLHGVFGRVLDTTATTSTIYEYGLLSTEQLPASSSLELIYSNFNLIVANGAAGLRCYSAHTGGSIILKDTEATSGDAYGVATDETYVFAAANTGGIDTFTMTGAGTFVPTSTCPVSESPFNQTIRQVAANTAVSFVFAGDIDGNLISYQNNAGALSALTGTTLPGIANVRDIAIHPGYSAVYSANGSDGIFAYNFDSSGGLSLVATYPSYRTRGLAVHGNFLFSASATYVDTFVIDKTCKIYRWDQNYDHTGENYVSVAETPENDTIIAGTDEGDIDSFTFQSTGTGAWSVVTSVTMPTSGPLNFYWDEDNRWLYASCGTDGLRLYYVSENSGMSLVDSDSPTAYKIMRAYPHNGFMAVAGGKAGVHLYKVSTNGALSLTDTHDPGQSVGVYSDGNFIYSTDYNGGNFVSYATDTAGNLSLIDTETSGSNTRRVLGVGDYLYVSDRNYGVRVYYADASGNLSIATSYSLADYASGALYWDEDNTHLYVGGGIGGLHLFTRDAATGGLSLTGTLASSGGTVDVWQDNIFTYRGDYKGGFDTIFTDAAGSMSIVNNITPGTGGDFYSVHGTGEYVFGGDSQEGYIWQYKIDGPQLTLLEHDTRAGTDIISLVSDDEVTFSLDNTNTDGIGLWANRYTSYDAFEAQTAQFVHSVYPSNSTPTLAALSTIMENGIGTVNASIHPRSVEWWQGRLWYGGLVDDGAYKDAVYWSNILNGMSIDLSNNVRIDAESGDEVMKILPVRSAKPRMYIFKRNSIHAFDVVWTSGAQIPTTENTIDTVNSNVVPLTTDIGTVAPNSVVHASGAGNSDVFFLARDGIRSLKRVEQDTAGGAGPPISDPIKDVIDRIHWSKAELATAAVYDHKLFMAIPVDGSTYNNLTLVYDLNKKRWVGEYTLKPRDMIIANFNDKEAKLFGAWEHVTTDVNAAGNSGITGRHIYSFLDDSTPLDPSNTAVEYIEETRAYSFGHLGKQKRWNWAEFEFTPAQTTITIGVYYKREDENYHLLRYLGIEPKYIFPLLPAQLPWDLNDPAKTIKRVSLMDVPVGSTIQLKLDTNSPGAFGTRTTRIAAWPLTELWE